MKQEEQGNFLMVLIDILCLGSKLDIPREHEEQRSFQTVLSSIYAYGANWILFKSFFVVLNLLG